MTAITCTTANTWHILRWVMAACFIIAMLLAISLIWFLMAPTGAAQAAPAQQAAAQTGIPFWQMMAIMGPTMSAFVGTWIWVDIKFSQAEARARESEAGMQAMIERMGARTDKQFEILQGQVHDILIILAGNRRERDSDADSTPKHQADGQ